MLSRLAKFAYRLFGRWVFRHRERFKPLAEELKKARLPFTVEEYVSLTILFSIVLFVLSFAAFFLLTGFYDLPLRFLISLVGAAGVTVLFAINFLNYPRLKAISRGSEIDAVLPFALMHMATLAGSGIPPHHIFRIMGKIDKYGEIARECRIIYRDVAILGKDIFSALSEAAKASPSRLWTEILWGISSTLRSGGSLRDYLYAKSRELQMLLERKERESVETMNLLTEIYLILFVLAPILGAIMLILMSMMAGGSVAGLSPLTLFGLLVYVITPAMGLIFLLIADNAKPREIV
ncbi:MAG: hypothetical protein GXO00_02795 [Candidatus Diapherotrites archaeon]|nr:hypothetical protein [Candidatus Diapherotrites archaeon]